LIVQGEVETKDAEGNCYPVEKRMARCQLPPPQPAAVIADAKDYAFSLVRFTGVSCRWFSVERCRLLAVALRCESVPGQRSDAARIPGFSIQFS
jgi:hypothetical protein